MSVVLIGYRGSGKTTVGRLLARKLARPFFDADEEIVAGSAMTIKEIFEKHGEDKFRSLESDVVARLAKLDDHVLSLGGGSVLRAENRQAIEKGKHTVIYLRADPMELHRRIHLDTATAANRPSLTALGGGIEEIRSVLASREPIYRKMAIMEIDVTAATPEQAVEMILKQL